MAQKVFREIWFFNQGFWMIWKYKLENDGLMYKILSFLSLISLVCLMFRNEERVVFIAIIVFFLLSCCLAFFLIFNQSSCFLWKLFFLRDFFNHDWYGCLAFEFQSSCFLWKLFFLRDFSTMIDMVVLHLNFNQVAFFENFSS